MIDNENLLTKFEKDPRKVTEHINGIIASQAGARKNLNEQWAVNKLYAYHPTLDFDEEKLRESGKLVRISEVAQGEGAESSSHLGPNLVRGTLEARQSETDAAAPEWNPVFRSGVDDKTKEDLRQDVKDMMEDWDRENDWEGVRSRCKNARDIYAKSHVQLRVIRRDSGNRMMLLDGKGNPVVGARKGGDGWSDLEGNGYQTREARKGLARKIVDGAKNFLGLGEDTYEEKPFSEVVVILKALMPYQVWHTGKTGSEGAHEAVIVETLERWEVLRDYPEKILRKDGTVVREKLDISKLIPSKDDTEDRLNLTSGGESRTGPEAKYQLRWFLREKDKEFPEGYCAQELGGEIVWTGVLKWGINLFDFVDIPIPDEPNAQATIDVLVTMNRLINRVFRRQSTQAQASQTGLLVKCDREGESSIFREVESATGKLLEILWDGDTPPTPFEIGGLTAAQTLFMRQCMYFYDLSSGRWDTSQGSKIGDQKLATNAVIMRQKETERRRGLHKRDALTEQKIRNRWLGLVTDPDLITEPRKGWVEKDGMEKEIEWDAKTLAIVKRIAFIPDSEIPKTQSQKIQTATLLCQQAPESRKEWAYDELAKAMGYKPPAAAPQAPPGLPPGLDPAALEAMIKAKAPINPGQAGGGGGNGGQPGVLAGIPVGALPGEARTLLAQEGLINHDRLKAEG